MTVKKTKKKTTKKKAPKKPKTLKIQIPVLVYTDTKNQARWDAFGVSDNGVRSKRGRATVQRDAIYEMDYALNCALLDNIYWVEAEVPVPEPPLTKTVKASKVKKVIKKVKTTKKRG